MVFDQQGSIGKDITARLAGTPFGITVDHQSLEDNTVTRERYSKTDTYDIEK